MFCWAPPCIATSSDNIHDPRGAAPPQVRYRPGSWITGDGTRRRHGVIELPQHDGSFGRERFEMEWTDGSRHPPWQRELEGRWSVLGHLAERHAYALGGEFEVGAWLPLNDIRYLDERTGEITPSRWNHRRWMAFAAMPNPTRRYLAVVGRFDERKGGFHLFVFDLVSDRVAEAGPAPARPPTDFECDGPRRIAWGDDMDHVVEMDAGVVEFLARRAAARRAPRQGHLRRTRRPAHHDGADAGEAALDAVKPGAAPPAARSAMDRGSSNDECTGGRLAPVPGDVCVLRNGGDTLARWDGRCGDGGPFCCSSSRRGARRTAAAARTSPSPTGRRPTS